MIKPFATLNFAHFKGVCAFIVLLKARCELKFA